MSDALTYKRKDFTQEQWDWCQRYLRETTFEPLMCDFVAGNETFPSAARFSLQWFESWSSDVYLRASAGNIPGWAEELEKEMGA